MNNRVDVEKYLHGAKEKVSFNDDEYASAKAILAEDKARLVNLADEAGAKNIWCLEQILDIHHSFVEAFFDIKRGAYYQGWTKLEKTEIIIGHLERHFDISNDDYHIASILRYTEQFQSLFPYTLFISPGFIHKSKSCSVCKAQISLRHPCGHVKGEIYGGEMCYHLMDELEPLEVSIVPNPVQKYSVLWTRQVDGQFIDHYDYSGLAYTIAELQGPYDDWELKHTHKREYNKLFPGTGRNERCPCNSGKKYKSCCLRKSSELRPHIEVIYKFPLEREPLSFEEFEKQFPDRRRSARPLVRD